MEHEMIFVTPVFKQTVWGGDKLRTEFGYDIPGNDTGECWAISTHPAGGSLVKGGKYDGKELSALWREHPELFGGTTPEEALLTKFIDARLDLSVQVHPDDAYAGAHENGALGKTEFWYILDCDPGATIIVGHNAHDKQELEDMVRSGRWKELLREFPIKKGDSFFIEPGTIHAIKGGTLIAEIQQTSNITYRLYDYDRLSGGRKRELHTEKSLDVIKVPYDPSSVNRGADLPLGNSADAAKASECIVSCDKFTVWKLEINGKMTFGQDRRFLQISVTAGSGAIDGRPVSKGENLILPTGYGEWTAEGDMELICSAI